MQNWAGKSVSNWKLINRNEMGLQMGTALGWEGNRLVVQRTGNPLTATLCIEWSDPITRGKELGTSGCYKSVPRLPTNLPYLCEDPRGVGVCVCVCVKGFFCLFPSD